MAALNPPHLLPLKSYETFDHSVSSRAVALHPQDTCGWFSRISMEWVRPLMVLGQTKQLDNSDVWVLRRELQAKYASRRFNAEYEATGSMYKAGVACFGRQMSFTGAAFLVSMLCSLLGPVVLRAVVSSLSMLTTADKEGGEADDTRVLREVFLWVGTLFAAQILQSLADNYARFYSEVVAIKLIASVKTLIFRKTLRLDAEARRDKSTGAITNLYTSDSEAILGFAFLAHQVWLIPLQIAVVSYMLYDVLGPAAFAGMAIIVLMLYVNNFISRYLFACQRIYRKSKDLRMKKVTEVFKAVGIVKFNAWEERFLEQIRETRATEMKDLFKRRLLACASVVMMWGMPVFISLASFGVYTGVMHRELSPAIVFTSIALFQLIQGPLRMIGHILPMLIQSKVAFERIGAFLEMTELDEDNVMSANHPSGDPYIIKKVIVAIQDGEFGWDRETSLLKDVNLELKAGDFVVVHGTVGCGKSSLCSALLGEMEKHKGTVYVGGSVAYCSQQPWIQNMTVRDNILFGLLYDRKKYEKVLDACALTEDLASLPAGDDTEIGERGVNLSGGQKARVALARACYSDASVYILDSPLSAVDAIVQNEIFQKCLLGLLKHKTILLVTHNPEIIASTHITRAVTIDEVGALVETHEVGDRADAQPLVSPFSSHSFGSRQSKLSYDSVSLDSNGTDGHANGHAVVHESDGLLERGHGETNSSNSFDFVTDQPDNFSLQKELSEETTERDTEMALVSPCREPKPQGFELSDSSIVISPKRATRDKNLGKLVQDEERVHGHVGNHVFSAYYRAVGGLPVVVVFLSTSACWQALQISSDFWLGAWSSDSLKSGPDYQGPAPPSTAYRLGIYSALGFAAALMVFARMFMTAVYGLRAARRMFDAMTNALMRAPMRFFDANPIGRILTRYGSDVSVVDANVPPLFSRLSSTLFSVGCSAATAAIVIRWKGLLLLPVVYLYYRIGDFYLRPARELQRLSKTTQAPVLNHLSESVDGGPVIRAYGQGHVKRFMVTHNSKLDANNKVWYARLCVSQWFSLHIQLVGSLLVLVVTTSLVMLRHELGAAVIGLAFSYALKVSQNLERLVQGLSEVEPLMVSPERLQEYTDIVQEAPARIEATDPPSKTHPGPWPSVGSIDFCNVCFRYKDEGQLVLHDLSFSVHGGEKLGIVGRTGAGKSSLTMALFRINELASGSILIDGVDISSLGLTTLREKLSIIPQNPVLFKGTLRSYLDPFEDFSDDELWTCLRQVGLGPRIEAEGGKLDALVEENGENFSVGERQMLCMVCSLLRKSRIVIFDEATAAVDHDTDQELQRVIREVFTGSTVLTIAHRLDTVLDSDRILVLDGGHLVEFASPSALVKKGSGHFFDLMDEGGYLDREQK